jgi:hypothetical protein
MGLAVTGNFCNLSAITPMKYREEEKKIKLTNHATAERGQIAGLGRGASGSEPDRCYLQRTQENQRCLTTIHRSCLRRP